ncbi:hypothetical protein BDZ45DRAFT_797000 [Acephala macrosclerotiorum]|nr:hypothetical protein BDZ45DRAFT_797000 [Acephala macrosclerotiorum]
MASGSSEGISSDALLNQDAMGAVTLHESHPSEEMADIHMADITDTPDTIDTPTERFSHDNAPRGIKRAFEEISEGDAEEDEEEANPDSTVAQVESGSQQLQPSKKQPKRAGIAELMKAGFVYIGCHVDQPLLGVWARLKSNGEVWTQGRLKNNRPLEELANWRSLVSFNGRVKMDNTKLDPAVAPDYQGDDHLLSHVQKTQLAKDYLGSPPAQEEQTSDIQPSESPEPPEALEPLGNARNDRDVGSHSGKKIFFEPSELLVGTYDDGADVFAKCYQRKRDKYPSLSFIARSISPRSKIHDTFAIHECIEFDKKYWRGSIDETKVYLKTFFKAKPAVEEDNQMLPRKLKSKAVSSNELCVLLDDSIGEGFGKVKAALDNVLAPNIVNNLIMPDMNSLRQEVGNLESDRDQLKKEISNLKSELAMQIETIASLIITKNDQAARIIELERTLVESLAASQSVVQVRDQTIREMEATKDSIVRENLCTLEPLQSLIYELERQLEESRTANQLTATDAHPGAGPQEPVHDVAAMQSRAMELEKALEIEKAANLSQAQKIASMIVQLQDQKQPPGVIDMQVANKEKDKQIKDLKEELSNPRSAQTSQTPVSGASLPAPNIPKLELSGQTFDGAYMRIPEDASRAIVYMSMNSQIMMINGKRFEKVETLQDGIIVGGESNGQDVKIGNDIFSQLKEDGLEKFVQHLSPQSLVEHEGKIMVKQFFYKQLPSQAIRF